MKVKITKPDSNLYEGEAQLLQLPGTGGIFEIMRHHAPIVSALKKGTLRMVVNEADTRTFEIRGGVVQCQNDEVLILVQ
ncbi:MAG: hypothetical protein MJZ51_05740 [Bacteroidales bacterium]|nr:hypothetical protein [Bacteroidales bacterium]